MPADGFKLSVIIPVYNVSAWIGHCVESLMWQTLKEGVEYIFVNDASTDDSIAKAKEIINHYPERKNQVCFLSHEVNKGLPAARNTGLAAAKGDYIFHCDSDDFVEPDMLELMLQKAESEDADMVWCDWFLSFNENERPMHQPDAASARKALGDMLNGSMKYNVWNKIVRRSLYTDNDIRFPDGYAMGEDMTMIRLAAKARRVAHVGKPLYHYIRVNTGAMSQAYDERKLNALSHNVDETIEFLRDNIKDDEINREIDWFLLNVKLPFLFTGNDADIRLWKRMYQGSNSAISSNKSQALRTRMLQWCAANNLTIVNKIYSRLIFNIIYGKIYK